VTVASLLEVRHKLHFYFNVVQKVPLVRRSLVSSVAKNRRVVLRSLRFDLIAGMISGDTGRKQCGPA